MGKKIIYYTGKKPWVYTQLILRIYMYMYIHLHLYPCYCCCSFIIKLCLTLLQPHGL